ncbi:MAG TPA: SMP-30/gluconolactonase/LRE family protein [Roseomonas sp.]
MTMNRRALLGAASSVATLAALPAAARWERTVRYPDPAIEVLDPAFARLRLFNAEVEQLWTGARWSEGPVWFGDMRAVFWSDIPNDRILRWDEASGRVHAFRRDANFPNGNTRDREGRLITCEHAGRRVIRTEHDGRITVLADRFEGKRLNSPNDAVVAADGAVWFTDPPFGIGGVYEGTVRADPELPTNVYRLDPATGALTVVAGDVRNPNGLAFTQDQRRLFLMNGGADPRQILVYDVVENGTRLANRRVFHQAEAGDTPDGFRCDTEGNLWCGWGMAENKDGVRVLNTEGKPVLHIHLPERCANLCFGGARRNRLFMAASKSLYSVYVGAQGAGLG